ncbi:hypothetical protein GCM10009584_03550 [Ornithinimicrobium humiphilum]|uniref:Uncharacterized protein n=1 Tax=Ornithinimicrobium humiphilum TaxID=125288 RepID=A0A543K7M3_9MICO|nr:hypothetical protein [Ornithinimicrobium humiphilum]TQM91086.1 hypothetical protein FB476_2809 [Ornithinimicrobium humiphilum]
MAETENDQQGECPRCQRRTLLRAVIEEVRGALGGELSREPAKFQICPVCGWNDLPDRSAHR